MAHYLQKNENNKDKNPFSTSLHASLGMSYKRVQIKCECFTGVKRSKTVTGSEIKLLCTEWLRFTLAHLAVSPPTGNKTRPG